MSPHEAGARALHRIEHPSASPTVWDDVDDNTRAWWIRKAGPIVEAVAIAARAEALEEAADLIEPFSGIGMSNGATRGEVACWLRARAQTYSETAA